MTFTVICLVLAAILVCVGILIRSETAMRAIERARDAVWSPDRRCLREHGLTVAELHRLAAYNGRGIADDPSMEALQARFNAAHRARSAPRR